MNIKKRIFKIFSIFIAVLLLHSNIVRPAPQFCLRQLAALEREMQGVDSRHLLESIADKVMEGFYSEDRPVGRHAIRTSRLALLIARSMGIPARDQVLLVYGALLHDVGFFSGPARDRWFELATKYKILNPIEEARQDLDGFCEKYDCQLLRTLREDHSGDILILEIERNIHLILAVKVRDICEHEGEDLSALEPVEGQLEKAFNHAEYSAKILRQVPAGTLQYLGLPQGLLSEALPIAQYHTSPSRMPSGTPDNIKRLTRILAAADSLEVANNRQRGRDFYNRGKETFEDTFFWLNRKVDQHDTTREIVTAVERLIVTQDPEMISVILEARETKRLPRYDLAFIESKKPAVKATNRVFGRLAGPVIIADIRNARGELVVPGALTIIDQALEAEGFVKPDGQEHFLGIGHAKHLLNEALKKDKFLTKESRYFTIRDEGKEKRVRRIVYHNRLYQEIIHEGKVELSNEEIDYLFNNLSDNSLGRYLLVYLRATNGNDNPALWGSIVARAGELSLSGEDLRTWEDVQNTMIDERSRLEIGNPDRPPFGETDMIDYDTLQDEIWQRTTAGVFSVSGIRQIFDSFFGNKPLPLRFPWRLGIGTEPTAAAKVHAATQAELFAQMLQDPSGFAERIPQLADQTVEQHGQIKRDFVSLLGKTQASKTKRKRKKITILLDTRSTGPALADVDIRTLIAEGVDVEYAFVGSVDEAAVYVKDNPDIDGCIYISASHNDEGYNGIKLLLGDGRVMPEQVAYPYIFVLRGDHPSITENRVEGVLEDASHTREIVAKVNAVDPREVRAVYERIPQVKQQSQQADWNYRNRVVTGVSTNQEAQAAIAEISDTISPLKLALISDPNGGAREDMGYLDALGIKTYRLNPRPRYDMDHELCPSTAAVAETTEALESIRDIAAQQGYTVIGSLHNDTDGDRRNYRPIDLKGEFSLRDDMVQICFALDVISYALNEYDFDKNRPARILGVSCNGPTGVLLEELAEVLGFVVIRTQTGEAYVVDGMERLSNMTWAELKEAAANGDEEIIIPDSVRRQFDASHDDEKIKVIVSGEGSNGSDFTPDLLVRDPIHTIKSLINFVSPTTGKQFMRALLKRLGREDEFDESWWDTGEGMATIMHRLISYLPASRTTDFFTIGGEGEMINPPLVVGLIKDNADDVFESDFRENTLSGLAGIWGVREEDISYEYVNYEERANPGRGNRRKKPAMGRQIGDGGYKIKFYIHRDGKKIPIGWIWFRDSITETGLTRMGASAVFPFFITGVQLGQQQEIVDKTYGFLKTTLGNLLQKTVAKTSEQILTADFGKLSPALTPYKKVLPAAQKNLRDYMQKRGISSPTAPVSAAEIGQAHDAESAAAAAI